ncbi:MAG: FAD-binding and (Fe-S)-binding domain-containing protein [Arcanobacterium sp.]|nr:FAD-binding and (Fe-S)-binding domain-containing protein [Arcanobacterium sp.]
MTTAKLPAVPADFIRELSLAVPGNVDFSLRARSEYATDASNYRVVPSAVVFPRNAQDVIDVLQLCREFQVPLTSRGAGTSVAGNAIGSGVVLDFSRHMNRILEIDPETQTALIEPGVVLSELQTAAQHFGLRFGPDPSTQNRATFGGMIGNNACGPHAVAWGRTADNVIELECVDGQGRVFIAKQGMFGENSLVSADAFGAQNSAAITDLGSSLRALVQENLAQIRVGFGRFSRQVSGYSLEHLLPENGENLARFLVGSEGTLAVILRARIKLVPIAQKPMLVVLGYSDMPTAADDVPNLLKFAPLAVEGLDAKLVEAVRKAKGSVPELPAGGGWLFIEVGALPGEDPELVPQRAKNLAVAANTAEVLILPAGAKATQLWRIRADGAGLGGKTPSGNAAWPGWEDSAVPPEHLGEYLRQLQGLMARMNLDGLMYGHFGDGCMHVRIDFPLDSATGVPVFREFMEQATDLAVKFGGSLSGEHGDGRARSELLSRMYPSEILDLFAQVKGIFDPDKILNPGVLVDPKEIDRDLRRPQAKVIKYAGGFHFQEDSGDFTKAVHRCTGVGNCRADRLDVGFFMCPSYQATKEEQHVTRGRMRVLQELTQTSGLLKGFSDTAVQDSLELCLSCKACSADCPTGVDVARYKSEFLYRRYKGKLRPRTHYLLGNLPTLARIVQTIPGGAKFSNFMMKSNFIRKTVFSMAGIDRRRKMPKFAEVPFRKTKNINKLLRQDLNYQDEMKDLQDEAKCLSHQTEQRKYVLLWADSFSETLDTRGAQALVELLQRHGYTVIIPPETACCGLTWITTGQLETAKKKLTQLLEVLAPFAASGIPIVGVEPSCTAVLRDDLLDLLPDDNRSKVVSRAVFTLAELLIHPEFGPEELKLPDLTGVEVIAQPHCHHYAVMGWETDEKLLAATGAKVRKLSGCCGLAGNFGMEQGHYETSVKVAENSLLPALREASPSAIYLADGFSCRTQAQQLAGKNGMHLAELLLVSS